MNDPIYKRLFSFRRMVADLLRAVGDPGWLAEVDFDTLERLPAEYVGDRWQQARRLTATHSRMLCILAAKQECQVPSHLALPAGELDRAGELGPPGRWPPVLPVVLYNGETPWAETLEMRELFGPMPESLAP